MRDIAGSSSAIMGIARSFLSVAFVARIARQDRRERGHAWLDPFPFTVIFERALGGASAT
jgi:hypothetical protein